ncbi:hypothetical protein M413DRAFT_446982 [Hebeloma cylindrosporum]|uniref:Uncharacterized protein n=1 Tax=Hebeloma cylindrosporum TaxID=76867 RepID=A0A0C3C5E8_HEBCY|nr:hypothetical protein M413DRAFT_446982 [Hebeloma cylindrosporum h7]
MPPKFEQLELEGFSWDAFQALLHVLFGNPSYVCKNLAMISLLQGGSAEGSTFQGLTASTLNMTCVDYSSDMTWAIHLTRHGLSI